MHQHPTAARRRLDTSYTQPNPFMSQNSGPWWKWDAALLILCAAGIFFLFSATSQPTLAQVKRATPIVETKTGFGSAFVFHKVNQSGQDRTFALTAAHVVKHDRTVSLRLRNRNKDGVITGENVTKAIVVERFDDADFAVLLLLCNPKDFPRTYFSPLAPVTPGEEVVHVGNLFGPSFDNALTVGRVSQIGITGERLPAWPWKISDSLDINIFHGSSGGPVFRHSDYRCIGIAVGVASPGLGIMVPVRVIKDYAPWVVTPLAPCPDDAVLFHEAEVTEPPADNPFDFLFK